jgi:hypothetical protein
MMCATTGVAVYLPDSLQPRDEPTLTAVFA